MPTRLTKILSFFAVILVCTCYTKAYCEGPEELNDLEVGFLYYKVSQLPIPWDHFANHYAEYRDARDEFQRLDVLERIKPVLEGMRNKVKKTNTFIVKFRSKFGEYSFQNNAFPTNIGSSSFIPTSRFRNNIKGPDFAIKFLNGQDFSFLKVDPQEARKKVIALRDSREVILEIEYETKGAGEDTMGINNYRVIDATIKKLKAYSQINNMFIGEMVR